MCNRTIVLLIELFLIPLAAQAVEKNPTRRSLPPQWPAEVLEVFFDDARTLLHGERPTEVSSEPAEDSMPEDEADNRSNVEWSSIINADALTAEIKRTHNRLTPLLVRSVRFKSGGNIDCRRDFSLLAALFRVIDQYDMQVRWQQDAAQASVLCARTADTCREDSDDSFALATEAHLQIANLLRGQSFVERGPIEELPIERGQLMQCMEVAVEDNLSVWLVDNREFRRHRAEVADESQLLAVLARMICSDGYEFADDDSFLKLARELQWASQDLNEAGKRSDYGAAEDSLGRLIQSCSQCHDGYRG